MKDSATGSPSQERNQPIGPGVDQADMDALLRDVFEETSFNLDLTCPECGAALADLVCETCQHGADARVDLRSARAPLVLSFGLLASVIVTIALSVVGFTIKGAIGALGGAVVGIALGASYRALAAEQAGAYRAAGHRLMRLAELYGGSPDSADLSAYCYCEWLRRFLHSGIRPSELVTIARFLRLYKHSPNAHPELRDALRERLFYRTMLLLVSQQRTVTGHIANAIAASVAESPFCISVAAWANGYCDPALRIQLYRLLSMVAPGAAAVFAGGGSESTKPIGKGALWQFDTYDIAPQLESLPDRSILVPGETLRYCWVGRDRNTIVTDRRAIFSQNAKVLLYIDPGVILAEFALDEIEKACSGKDGTWLCTASGAGRLCCEEDNEQVQALVLEPLGVDVERCGVDGIEKV